MSRNYHLPLAALALAALSFASRPADAQSLNLIYDSFQAPGADLGSLAAGVSANGTVLGSYADSDAIVHGYIRSPNGTYTTFDNTDYKGKLKPGNFAGTWMVGGINNAGDVNGYFLNFDSNNAPLYDQILYHNGKFLYPQVKDAVYTDFQSVNEAGLVAAPYKIADGSWHSAIYNIATTTTDPFTLLPDIKDSKNN